MTIDAWMDLHHRNFYVLHRKHKDDEKKKKKPSAVKKGDTQGWSLLIGYWDLSYKRCWQETQTINKGAARWRKILAKKDNFGTGFLKNTKMGLWSKRRPFVQGGGWSIHKASSV